jgi:hypothetical protein
MNLRLRHSRGVVDLKGVVNGVFNKLVGLADLTLDFLEL